MQSGTQRDPPQIRSASVEPDIACAHVDACRSRDACIHTYYARTCAYMHKHGLPPETHSSRLQKRIRLVFFRQIGLRQSRQVAHRMTTRIQTPVRTRVSTWKASAPTWKASALSPLDSAMPSHPAHRIREQSLEPAMNTGKHPCSLGIYFWDSHPIHGIDCQWWRCRRETAYLLLCGCLLCSSRFWLRRTPWRPVSIASPCSSPSRLRFEQVLALQPLPQLRLKPRAIKIKSNCSEPLR